MINSTQAREIIDRLETIVQLAREIEAVPNFGPDVWTMREIDRKCQHIKGHCGAISRLTGTGDVLHSTNIGPGHHPISPDHAAMAQRHLGRMADLAQAIEDVPNFGPDIWSMRRIDEDCAQIAWHATKVLPLLFPRGTGPG